MLHNGTFPRLKERPSQFEHFLFHNIDTLGVNVDTPLLGMHLLRGNGLTFEVIRLRIGDPGGGLARVGGQVRSVERLEMLCEEDEFRLSYYDSMTTCIYIDALLDAFGLTRSDMQNSIVVETVIRANSARMPT